MFLNNYLLTFFNILVGLIFLAFLLLKGDRIFYKVSKATSGTIAIGIIGIMMASIVGYANFKLDTENGSVDLARILNFLALFCIPIVLSNYRYFLSIKSNYFFSRISLIFVLFIGVSLFTAGIGNSAFFGNLFGATTVNLGVVSLLAIGSLQSYYRNKNKIGLYLAIIGYIITFASLAKWNLVVMLFLPYYLYKVLKDTIKRNKLSRFLIVIFSLSIISLIVFNKDKILNSFARLNQYDDIESYFNSRVMRGNTGDSNVKSGVLALDGGDVVIKDGARFALWFDLIDRTSDSPIIGLGLGARALESENINVEDHSIFVFFISRFGIPIFILFFIQIFRLHKRYYKVIVNPKFKLSKHLFTILLLNFYFQASVGNIWGQIFYVFMLGLIIHIYFVQPQIIYLKKEK